MNPANQQTVNANAQLEALRRRASMPASSAAIGSDLANSLSPGNPIAVAGSTSMMTNPPKPQAPEQGAAGFQSGEATGQLKQQKSEAETIVDALIYRLRRLSPNQAESLPIGV